MFRICISSLSVLTTSGNFERTSRVVTGLTKDEVLGGSSAWCMLAHLFETKRVLFVSSLIRFNIVCSAL